MFKIEQLILFSLIIILLIVNYCNFKEDWVGYIQKPYKHTKTGSKPYNFYALPRYRKPYRYPFQFTKTAPYNHKSYLD